MRTLTLNYTYYIICRVVRVLSSLIALNKHIYSSEPKFLLSAYNEATSKICGYILLHLNQSTPEELGVVTDILTINYCISTRE